MKKIDKETIQYRLDHDDMWLERGVYAIWKFQTESEKKVECTHSFNGVGFNGVDGHIMTSFGNQIHIKTNRGNNKQKFGTILSPKQKYIARKKMKKYAGQLLRIAEANEEKKPAKSMWNEMTGCCGYNITFDQDGHMNDFS